jgi:hypothetical protein
MHGSCSPALGLHRMHFCLVSLPPVVPCIVSDELVALAKLFKFCVPYMIRVEIVLIC